MYITTKVRSVFNKLTLAYLALVLLYAQVSTVYARDEECSFTVKPVSACEISFYKLLAIPEKYNKKYISVKGYMAIDNGRLAVYPTESSFSFGISQDSFSVAIPFDEREKLARDLNRSNVRIVGLFNYQIIGDKPGVGYISILIDAHPIGPRPEVTEDRYLSRTPEDQSKQTKKAKDPAKGDGG